MILVLQFRIGPDGPHELKCIYDAAGVPYDEFRVLNAYSKELTADEIITLALRSRAFIIGGSGQHTWGDDDPAFLKGARKTIQALRELLKKDLPIIGLCFGLHCIVETLGGTVKQESKLAETGITTIKLNEQGKKDPIFSGMGNKFSAINAHKASVTKMPKDTINLATTERCPIQALKYKDNVYAFEFHPELNMKELEYRLSLYPDYRQNSVEKPEDDIIETPRIVRNFLNMVGKENNVPKKKI